LSGGRIDIKLYHAGEIVPGLQVADAVSNNYVDLGYTLRHYYVAKDPAFAFLSHIPFGLEPRAHLAWRQRGDVTAIFNRFLAEYRIIAIPCGAFGRPEEFLSRKPIHSPAHLNGLKMRVAAWPARIYSALKVMPQQLAAGDIYPALENGTIDAVQWLTPRSTLMLGFNKVARYYYYPGVVVPAQIVDLFINKSAWDGLPPAAQQVLERACADAANAMIADYDTADRAALDTMRASGTEIAPLPDLVQKQLYDAYRQMSEVTPHNATVRSLIQTIDAKDTLAAKIR
jgi:TRAP-type mannitol/chloroaromatic compound transport system substrate-binding protein